MMVSLPAEVSAAVRKYQSDKEAAGQHGDLAGPLEGWFRIAKEAQWRSLADVRLTYKGADAVGQWTVFEYQRKPLPADCRDQLCIRSYLHSPRSDAR